MTLSPTTPTPTSATAATSAAAARTTAAACPTCGQSPCACGTTTRSSGSGSGSDKSDTFTPSSAAGDAKTASPADAGKASGARGKPLTDDQQKEVDALKARDAHVRAHEAAHLAAAGGFARGGPSFTFQAGPDGKQYAIGGEVNVDVAGVPGDPAATIRKMQTIRRAALAPEDPSGQDRSVAAQAAATELQAQAQLAKAAAGGPAKRASGVNDVGRHLDVAA